MQWTVVLALKALPRAKSRLRDASDDDDQHARLVRAMRADTLAAVHDAQRVARVVIVLDRPDGSHPGALVQSRPGLNAALAEGAAHAAQHWSQDGVVALVADLPALRGADLDAALDHSCPPARAYVPDAAGTGTTMLAVAPGIALRPKFGAGSAARHAASGALAIPAAPGLRCDVDTRDDLQRAARLGLGSHTRVLHMAEARC